MRLTPPLSMACSFQADLLFPRVVCNRPALALCHNSRKASSKAKAIPKRIRPPDRLRVSRPSRSAVARYQRYKKSDPDQANFLVLHGLLLPLALSDRNRMPVGWRRMRSFRQRTIRRGRIIMQTRQQHRHRCRPAHPGETDNGLLSIFATTCSIYRRCRLYMNMRFMVQFGTRTTPHNAPIVILPLVKSCHIITMTNSLFSLSSTRPLSSIPARSRRQPFGITREQGRSSDVVELEEEHEYSLKTCDIVRD
jgi:hypothetical protein